MKRRYRFPAITLLLAVSLSVFGIHTLAQEPVEKQTNAITPANITITREDRSVLKSTTTATSLKVKVDHGILDVNLAKVQSVALRKDGDRIIASLEFTDHNRIQSTLVDTTIPIVIEGKTETLTLASVTEIKFPKTKNLSLIAIIVGLLTLTVMEIVLGVDNIIFLAIVAGKLPEKDRPKARQIGLVMALGTRLLLLFTLSFLLGLTRPLFTLPQLPFLNDPEARDISARDLILLVGGLFLIYQSVREMHEKFAHAKGTQQENKHTSPAKAISFTKVVVNIALIDILFSLDSVITAVGMVEELWVMVTAMVLSMFVMLIFAKTISDFVDRNPTIKILALSFLILIGVLLAAEALGQHIDKGYIYFAMAFAVIIEVVNMKLRPKKPESADQLA